MPLLKLQQIQSVKNCIRLVGSRFRHANEHFFLCAFRKQLMVDILHDHIAQGQPLLSIIRFFIYFHNAFAMLLQSAEATGQGGFSSSVMTDHCDNARLWQRKTVNIQRIPLLCISKMKILTFDRTTACNRMCCHRERAQVKRPQPHFCLLRHGQFKCIQSRVIFFNFPIF